jgi:hypothetical protein
VIHWSGGIGSTHESLLITRNVQCQKSESIVIRKKIDSDFIQTEILKIEGLNFVYFQLSFNVNELFGRKTNLSFLSYVKLILINYTFPYPSSHEYHL